MRKANMKANVFLISILFCLLMSCNTDDHEGSDLAKNRELWESHETKNYSINQSTRCFCGGVLEWDLSVINGLKHEVKFDETLLHLGQTYQDILNEAKTVEDIFDYVESLENQKLASLTVLYDEEYGFPRLISIDFSEAYADDEIEYVYADFVKVN